MEELWRDVTGYEGIYQISSLGRVKRINNVDSTGRPQPRAGILKPNWNGDYYIYRLYKDGKVKARFAHGLVAEAFIGAAPCCSSCGSQLEVNHKDQNPYNNCSNNLEYVSSKENKKLAKEKHRQSCQNRRQAVTV